MNPQHRLNQKDLKDPLVGNDRIAIVDPADSSKTKQVKASVARDYMTANIVIPADQDLTAIQVQTIWVELPINSVQSGFNTRDYFYIVVDDASDYNVGGRLRFFQGSARRFGLIIAIDNTNERVYILPSQSHTLTATTPSSVEVTYANIPPGTGNHFLDPNNFTLRVTDNTDRAIAPAEHVVRIPGALTIDVPPGDWEIRFRCTVATEAHYSTIRRIPEWRIGYSTDVNSFSTRTLTQGQVASVSGRLDESHGTTAHVLSYDAGRNRPIHVGGHAHQTWYPVISFHNITDTAGNGGASILNLTKLNNSNETSWVQVRSLYV